MAGLRLLASFAAVAVIAKLADDNRRLRQEVEYLRGGPFARSPDDIAREDEPAAAAEDSDIDKTLEDSFPASDPPSFTARH